MDQILLVRHAESEKNIEENFDGNASLDTLTAHGRKTCAKIADALLDTLEENSIKFYSAESGRARETAKIISGDNLRAMETVNAFGSMRSGPFAGMDDKRISIEFPVFFSDLQLFRAGLLSGYRVRKPEGAEKWIDFEERLSAALEPILADDTSIKIIVCHRSAMIALLNRFARQLLGYPSSHFGFVSTPPLFSALVRQGNPSSPLLVGEAESLVGQLSKSHS